MAARSESLIAPDSGRGGSAGGNSAMIFRRSSRSRFASSAVSFVDRVSRLNFFRSMMSILFRDQVSRHDANRVRVNLLIDHDDVVAGGSVAPSRRESA